MDSPHPGITVDLPAASERDPAEAPETAATSTSAPQTRKPISFYISIIVLMLLAVITSWDTTSIALALPTITRQLGETSLFAFWLSLSIIFGSVAFMPYFTSSIDFRSPKLLLRVSMFLYAVGSIMFAVTDTRFLLLTSRLWQGAGVSGLQVFREVLLNDITNLEERPKYLHFLAMAQAVGGIAGPLLGTALSEPSGWRTMGWVNFLAIGVV
ncbi:major facilitator superfamily domain-containing protein [Hypoxylon cercidicola]|nr:major facilitator superfamily domain-containing protein [Hypoxylon cercidicola]